VANKQGVTIYRESLRTVSQLSQVHSLAPMTNGSPGRVVIKRKGVMHKLGFLIWLMACSAANATVITLDADDFAPGTDISDGIPGASIFWTSQQPTAHLPSPTSVYAPETSRVVSTTCELSHLCSGQQVFASEGIDGFRFWEVTDAYACERGGSGHSCRAGFSVINVLLDRPTDFFSLDMYVNLDQPAIYAFDTTGSLLFSCFVSYLPTNPCAFSITPDNGHNRTTMSFSRTEADVSRVMLGIVNGTGRLESISVSVPEPATILLMGIGLLGALVTRRRVGYFSGR